MYFLAPFITFSLKKNPYCRSRVMTTCHFLAKMSHLSQVRFFQENHVRSMYLLAPFIAGRRFLTSLFYEDLLPPPPIYGLLLLFQFCPTLPLFPIAFSLHPYCSFCCIASLAVWVILPHLMCHLMLLWICICQTLVS